MQHLSLGRLSISAISQMLLQLVSSSVALPAELVLLNMITGCLELRGYTRTEGIVGGTLQFSVLSWGRTNSTWEQARLRRATLECQVEFYIFQQDSKYLMVMYFKWPVLICSFVWNKLIQESFIGHTNVFYMTIITIISDNQLNRASLGKIKLGRKKFRIKKCEHFLVIINVLREGFKN